MRNHVSTTKRAPPGATLAAPPIRPVAAGATRPDGAPLEVHAARGLPLKDRGQVSPPIPARVMATSRSWFVACFFTMQTAPLLWIYTFFFTDEAAPMWMVLGPFAIYAFAAAYIAVYACHNCRRRVYTEAALANADRENPLRLFHKFDHCPHCTTQL